MRLQRSGATHDAHRCDRSPARRRASSASPSLRAVPTRLRIATSGMLERRARLRASRARSPARSVKSKPAAPSVAAQRAQHAPAGTRFARQLAAGDGALVAGRRGWSAWRRFRARQPIGRITSATARVDAHANWLNATTCALATAPASARRLVGEIQAGLDAVEHVGTARVAQHRLRIARRPAARRRGQADARSRPAGCGRARRWCADAKARAAARIALACGAEFRRPRPDDHDCAALRVAAGRRSADARRPCCDGATICLRRCRT